MRPKSDLKKLADWDVVAEREGEREREAMMKSEHGEIVHVTMKFEDGYVQELLGDDAKAWLEDLNGQVSIAFVHGFKMKEHPWRVKNG